MNTLARLLTRTIDRFYIRPVRAVMPLQTFRYAACGAFNMALSWVLFYVMYHFVFDEVNFDLGVVVISPHVASMLVVFPVNFIVGFYLNKYVAFVHSPLRNRTQLIRYALSVCGSLVLNYALLKILVETLHVYPTPSQIVSTLLVTVYSYLVQKYFTFRGCEE